MLYKRKSIYWLIALCLIASMALVACGGGQENVPSDNSGVETDQSGEETSDTEQSGETVEEGDEEVLLRMFMQQDNRLVTAMQDIVASFEEAHPNISVQLEPIPFPEYHQRLSTSFAGNDAPDLMWMDVRVASYARQGVLMPLDDRITAETRDDFLASSWQETQYEGQTYSIPLHQLTEGLYVNTQLAEEAGIELPQTIEDAWTWEEFLDIATQLTQRSGDQTDVWGFGVQRHLQEWSVLPVIYQHGGQVFSEDLSTVTGYLNSPETVEALTWYGALFNEHRVMSVEPIPDGFQTGGIAIFQAPSSFRPVLDNDYPDLDYTIVPMFRDEQCKVMTGGWNASISAATEHPEEAWMLLDWITGEKHEEWVENSGYLPARQSVITSGEKFQEYPWNIFMTQLQECAATRPPVLEYTFFNNVFEETITSIAIGEDPQTTLDSAAQQLDAELAD